MDLHERLVAARKQAGFENAREAAEAVGVPYPTYAGHENGSSGFRSDKGEIYARKFKVRFEWLMREIGPMTEPSPKSIVALAAKYRDVIENFDSLPTEAQEAFAESLRVLAGPYKATEPDQERAPAKAK